MILANERGNPMADAVHYTGPDREDYDHRHDPTVMPAILRRTSWGAVIAGAVAAISTQMILTLLGIAIGATTSDVAVGSDRIQHGITTAAAAWWLASGTIAILVGGCVVGRLTGMVRSPDVLLHGFTMWAVTALFGFLVVSAGAGALYGTSLDATYSGSRAMYDRGDLRSTQAVNDGRSGSAAPTGEERVVTRDEAQRYVRNSSWLSLLGLALGIAAALGGSWLAAPERIVVAPPSQRPS